MNCLELCFMGHIFMSCPAAIDERITEARGFVARVPEKILFDVSSSVMLNLLCCYVVFSSHVKSAKHLFFSQVAIGAAQCPTPVFVSIIQDKRKKQTNPKLKAKVFTPWKRTAEAFSTVNISVEQLIFILRQSYENGKSCQQFLSTADKNCFENLFQDNSAGSVHLALAEFCRQKQDSALKSYCSVHESCWISSSGWIYGIYTNHALRP